MVRAIVGAASALALAWVLLGMRCPQATPGAACITASNRGFAAVAAASGRTLEACWADPGGSAGALEECLARDAAGWIAAARQRSIDAEALACRESAPPPFGYTGAENASAAAADSVTALAHGLFGRDLDAARPSDTAGVRCQKRVLAAAGRCARAFVSGYTRCTVAALGAGAEDPFDLVACKGVDPDGTLAIACEDGVAAEVAACASRDPAALFPGCAGDLTACAIGHARRSASLAINEADALCGDVPIGGLDEPALLQCFEPPPLEPIETVAVPVPEGVNPSNPDWDASGEFLIFSFTAPDVTGNQLARMRPDGSDFQCLTCGSAIAGNLRPTQRFADGRRVLVAGPNNPAPRWRVLECTPSLADCQGSELLPIVLPRNPDPATAILQYRVPHVSSDDAWFVWSEVRARGPGGNVSAMGRLVREPTRYVVTDARVIAPPLTSLDVGTDGGVWRNFTQAFEAKAAQLRGGRDWVEAGTPTAGQYDDLAIDLETGDMRRITRHADHDEGIVLTRDEEWSILASARTSNRVEFLGLLPRPPYIDWIAFSVHFVAIAGQPGDGISPGGSSAERDCYIDPWMLDRWGERGDYIGQRLLTPTADGWSSTAGGVGWSPDGTRIVLTEGRWKRLTPAGEAQQNRMLVATLPNRAPIDPGDVVPVGPTPEPTWAIRYEDYVVPDTFGITVIPGAVSGTATIRNAMPTPVQGEVEVTFADYSDDGESVLDGTELLRIPVIVLEGAEYEVDLTLRGAHTGSMRGSIRYDFTNDVNAGEVVSELDGRVLTGPTTCYDAGLLPIP